MRRRRVRAPTAAGAGAPAEGRRSSMPQEQGHRWFAAIYDRMMASAERSFMKGVREEIAGGAGGRVLELGAGTGANFAYYGLDADEVFAIEPDQYMLDRARPRADEAPRPLTPGPAPA